MLSGKRLLIVEAEALIALDMQRIAEEAGAARVEIARDYHDLLAMEDRLTTDYDLLVVAPPHRDSDDKKLLARLADTRLAIVLCTAALAPDHCRSGHVELVVKPFSDDELMAAFYRALATKAPAGDCPTQSHTLTSACGS